MLKIVSTAHIREIDRIAIDEFGIPETILMENAGLQALSFLEECLGPLDDKRIAVFCGKGNNGGDGFVVARHLHIRGVQTAVYLLAEKKALKGNAKLNMEIYEKIGGTIKEITTDAALKKNSIAIRHADVILDAILGTGLKAELNGVHLAAVKKINEWKRFCLSVDIPTGLDSDRGAIHGLHVEADATVTFGFPKTGMMFYPALASVGRLKRVNIGFPPKLLEKSPCDAFLLDAEWVRAKLPSRPDDAHKGRFGHAVVTGGSTGMGGAIGLAAMAALKVGAGLVTAAVPKSLGLAFELGLKEVMSFHLGNDLGSPENIEAITAFAQDKSALLIGPGMKQGNRLTALVEGVLRGTAIPTVIDADGLNNLAPKKEVLKKAKAEVIVTPHPGEMARLTGKTTDEINADRLATAKNFSREYGCVTVLKGARTVIAAPDGAAYVNPTGNSNLASGGTGDVLGGMIAGYLAQGLSTLDAAAVAVYLHGLSADLYTQKNDPYSLTAGNIIDCLPHALRSVLS